MSDAKYQPSALPAIVYLISMFLVFVYFTFKCYRNKREEEDLETGKDEEENEKRIRAPPKVAGRVQAWWAAATLRLKCDKCLRLWKIRRYLISSPYDISLSNGIEAKKSKKMMITEDERGGGMKITDLSYNPEFLAVDCPKGDGTNSTTLLAQESTKDKGRFNLNVNEEDEESLTKIVFAQIESSAAVNSGNVRILSPLTLATTSNQDSRDELGYESDNNNNNSPKRDHLNDPHKEQRPAGAREADKSRPTLISRYLSVQVDLVDDDPIYDVPPSRSLNVLAPPVTTANGNRTELAITKAHSEKMIKTTAYVHSSTPNILYLLKPTAAPRQAKRIEQQKYKEEDVQMMAHGWKDEEEEESIYDTPSIRSLAI